MKSSTSTWRELTLITLGYALLAAVMTYPLLFQLNGSFASHTPDVYVLAWDNWWIQHALSSGQNIFFTNFMFYPQGVSLAAHSFSFTHTLISSAFQVLTNPIAAYNLAIFAIFPIGGLGMYLLAKHLTLSRAAAWIAGLIYTFAPYHMTQALGHPHLSYVQFIPFAVLFTLKVVEANDSKRPERNEVESKDTPSSISLRAAQSAHPHRTRDLIAAIVFFTLTAYAGQHLLVVAFTWLIVFLPIDFIANRRSLRKPAVLSLIGIVLGTLVFSFPLYQPALSDILHGQSIQALQTGEFDDTQTDALAYFIPTRYHPVFGASLEETYRNLGKNNLWMPYLGYAALLLAIVGIASQRRKSLAWAMSGLVCIVLALGPQLKINGVTYANIPLPFAALQNIFPFSFLRSPDRFNIVVSLPLAVLAAYGFAAMAQKLSSTRGRVITTTVLSGLILFEYLSVPYPMMPLPEQSPFVTQLADETDPYAVLDLPMGRNPSKVYLYWQTLHHKPLIEGHVSRTPDRAYDFIENNLLLRALRNSIKGTLTDEQRVTAMQQLADQHVRYLLVHIPMSNPDQIDQYRAIIAADPIYADELVQVYAVGP